jgi:hypothetical protein
MVLGFLVWLLAAEALPAGTEAVLRLPAWEAQPWGSGVVVLEPDFLHVSVHDAATGKQRWRTRFQEKAGGFHSIHVVGDRLFVYAGNHLTVIRLGSGQVLRSHDVPYHRDRLNTAGCTFNSENGACALECDCQLQFRSCKDGAPIGKEYRSTEICFTPMDDADVGGCNCFPGASAFGRAADLLLASIEDVERKSPGLMHGPRAVVAVNARTGKEVYRAAAPGVSSWWREGSGISPDGQVCWLRGGGDDGLKIFACQTGELLAHRTDCGKFEPPPGEPVDPAESPPILGIRKVGESLFASATRSELRIFALKTREELARIEGQFLILAVEGALGPGRVGVFRYAKEGPGEVWILKRTPGGADARQAPR